MTENEPIIATGFHQKTTKPITTTNQDNPNVML